MEMILGNGFCEMSQEEMMETDGGGWKTALSAFAGTIAVAFTPVGCVLGGPGVGAGMFGLGCAALDYACDKAN